MSDDLRAAIHLLEQSLYSMEWADVFKFEDEGVYYVEIAGAKLNSPVEYSFSKSEDPLKAAQGALSLWVSDKYASHEEIYSLDAKKDQSKVHRVERKMK